MRLLLFTLAMLLWPLLRSVMWGAPPPPPKNEYELCVMWGL